MTVEPLAQLAAALVGCEPTELKGYRLLPDGSLAVITPTGQKFIFTPEQVAEVQRAQLAPPETVSGAGNQDAPSAPAMGTYPPPPAAWQDPPVVRTTRRSGVRSRKA